MLCQQGLQIFRQEVPFKDLHGIVNPGILFGSVLPEMMMSINFQGHFQFVCRMNLLKIWNATV